MIWPLFVILFLLLIISVGFLIAFKTNDFKSGDDEITNLFYEWKQENIVGKNVESSAFRLLKKSKEVEKIKNLSHKMQSWEDWRNERDQLISNEIESQDNKFGRTANNVVNFSKY